MASRPTGIAKLWSVYLKKSNAVKMKAPPPLHLCNKHYVKNSAAYSSFYRKVDVSSLFIPVPVQAVKNTGSSNIGEELTGRKLEQGEIKNMIREFSTKAEVKELSSEYGIDRKLFPQALGSFQRWCVESEVLDPELHVIFNDILQGEGNVADLFPYFIKHAYKLYPALTCMSDLKKISDMKLPANWEQFQPARNMARKIYFHAGPTNSGKTYHALESFLKAKSGIYCAPLKLLAVEVMEKANSKGTPCDLITGEEKRFAASSEQPANHISCTVEMASFSKTYDVAIIDEIQMMSDRQRGGAWTRALFGLPAKEIHLCGEEAAIELIKSFCEQIGEVLEVRKYKRLTPLVYEKKAVERIDNIRPGDCIVCFKKTDIHDVTRQLELRGMKCAVIYGSLPPSTKLAQARKFNDPNDPCKILVATDAVGMGLNLNINRIVFYSLKRSNINRETGEKEDYLSTSSTLQIAGRAGRFSTQFSRQGTVTTFRNADLPILNEIIARPIEKINVAGLLPTPEQIEQFANLLPHATLMNLVDLFLHLCEVDVDQYFLCEMESFRYVANMIKDVSLDLRTRYVFCCAPVSKDNEFVAIMYPKIANRFSKEPEITCEWLCKEINWPLPPPKNIDDLTFLEWVFDVLDLYLWLGYRFNRQFPDMEKIRQVQKELDEIINQGVTNIVNLIKSRQRVSTYYDYDEREGAEALDEYTVADDVQSADPDSSSLPITRHSHRQIGVGKTKRLTEKLIREGVLSGEMVEQLRKEWKGDDKKSPSKRK